MRHLGLINYQFDMINIFASLNQLVNRDVIYCVLGGLVQEDLNCVDDIKIQRYVKELE
jgi:hypothetical protein